MMLRIAMSSNGMSRRRCKEFVFCCLTIPLYINTQPPTPPIFWYVGQENTVWLILIIVWCVYINKCISLWSYLIFNSIIYVISFLGCKVLTNYNRLRCVFLVRISIISINIGQKFTLLYIRKKEIWHVESSLYYSM